MLVSLPSDQLATMPLLPGSSGTWFFFLPLLIFFIYDYVFRQLTEYGGTSTSYTQTKHEISLQQLLSPHGRRCRKVGVSFHVQAKHLRRIACFHCSEIRARYHPNPTPDRWPLESLPLGSETGIQVSAVVGIGDHLGRQLPVSLLVPVSVASVDTTLLPTKFWRRNGVEPEVGALVSILKFGNPQASVIGIGGRLEGSGSLSPSERWFHYS